MCKYQGELLTGTAAISVGFRAEISPWLPFFTLLDWSVRVRGDE